MASPRAPFQSPTRPIPINLRPIPLKLSPSSPVDASGTPGIHTGPSRQLSSYDTLLRALGLSGRTRSSSPGPAGRSAPVPELNIIPPTPAMPSGLLPAFEPASPPRERSSPRTRTRSRSSVRRVQSLTSLGMPSPPFRSNSTRSPSSISNSPSSPLTPFSPRNDASPPTPFTPPIVTPPMSIQPFSPHASRQMKRRYSTGDSPTSPEDLMSGAGIQEGEREKKDMGTRCEEQTAASATKKRTLANVLGWKM